MGPDRSGYIVRKTTLAEEAKAHDLSGMTPGERVLLVALLTRDAWTFKEGRWNEPRLRRDVGRVVRGGR